MRHLYSCGLTWLGSLTATLTVLCILSPLARAHEPPMHKAALPKVEKDVQYAAGGDQHKLDLYLPQKAGFSTIVFTYGGGWHTGSRKSVTPIGEKLQSLGYGFALLSHRLGPKDKFPAQIEDVAAGFAWVKRHIGGKGGNPNRVFVVGHSSGAHLFPASGRRPQVSRQIQPGPQGHRWGGRTEYASRSPTASGRGFGDALLAGRGADVFGDDVAIMKDASPIRHITKNLPPVLLIVGEQDFPMLQADAKAFVAKAKAHKTAATYFITPSRNHMGVVRALLDAHSDVLEALRAFVKKHQQ